MNIIRSSRKYSIFTIVRRQSQRFNIPFISPIIWLSPRNYPFSNEVRNPWGPNRPCLAGEPSGGWGGVGKRRHRKVLGVSWGKRSSIFFKGSRCAFKVWKAEIEPLNMAVWWFNHRMFYFQTWPGGNLPLRPLNLGLEACRFSVCVHFNWHNRCSPYDHVY